MGEFADFDQWLDFLKKENPNIQWDILNSSIIEGLREMFEEQAKNS